MSSAVSPGSDASEPPAGSIGVLPRHRARWLLPTLVVILVGVVILSVLALGGFFGRAEHPLDQYPTFAQAEPVAANGSAGQAGGPWTVVASIGVRVPSSAYVPTSNLTSVLSLLNCTVTLSSGVGSTYEVAATPPSEGPGASGFWLFVLEDGGHGLLIVSVSLGLAAPLFRLGGPSCGFPGGTLVPFPSSELDTPAIVQSANASGGAAFLAGHPNATQTWVGTGGVDYFGLLVSPPIWYVTDTTCLVGGITTTPGLFFNASVYGESGYVRNHSAGPGSCLVSIPTGLTFLGSAGGDPPAVSKAI